MMAKPIAPSGITTVRLSTSTPPIGWHRLGILVAYMRNQTRLDLTARPNTATRDLGFRVTKDDITLARRYLKRILPT